MALSVPRPTYANVVATTALLIAAGGSAVAATGTPTPPVSAAPAPAPAVAAQATPKTITACSVKKGKKKGTLRIATKCKKSESKLQWLSGRVVGARGPAGAAGPAGAQGPAGPAGIAPAGAVLHFDLPACPAGWSPYSAAQGRTIVGTPAGGTNGAQVGSALGDQENRAVGKHGHGITDPGHTHLADMAAQVSAGNVVPRTFQGNADLQNPGDAFDIDLPTQSSVTGITVDEAGSVAGTNAPYVQLITCRKD